MAIGLDEAVLSWLVAPAGSDPLDQWRGDAVRQAIRQVVGDAVAATLFVKAGHLRPEQREHLRSRLWKPDPRFRRAGVSNPAELRAALRAWTAALDRRRFGRPGYLARLGIDADRLGQTLADRIEAGIRQNGRAGGPLAPVAERLWPDEQRAGPPPLNPYQPGWNQGTGQQRTLPTAEPVAQPGSPPPTRSMPRPSPPGSGPLDVARSAPPVGVDRPPPASGTVYASSQLRSLVAQMPNRVPRSAEFSAIVRVTSRADDFPHAAAAPLSALEVPEGGTRVTVVVQAPHSLTSLGELEQVITVPAAGDSAPVRFSFQAREVGLQRLLITAWVGGTFLAELALEVSVEERAPYVDAPPRTVPVGPVSAEPGEVTLQVRYDGRRYTFQLLSESYLFEPVIAEALTAEPGQSVERAISTLRSIAAGSSGYTGGAIRRWMEETGVGLWNDMVPDAIKQQFFRLRANMASFTIATGGDAIPWELLYPLSPDYDEGFLVEQLPVLRRVYGQARFRNITIGNAHYVVPSGSPANARTEIATIQRIVDRTHGPPQVIDDLDGLLHLIDSGSSGMIHFACHNTFDPAKGGSVVKLSGGPFVPSLLNRAVTRGALAGRNPLIFINACRSAGTVPEYTRMSGWAQQFMAAGAGAFVGTLWAVRNEGAGSFAEAFYGALSDGEPLGEASRRARLHAGRDHTDPTWLAYSVYGNPTAGTIR